MTITCKLPSGREAEILDAAPGRALIHVQQGWTFWTDRANVCEVKQDGQTISPLRSAVDAVLISHVHTAVNNATIAELERIGNL